MFLIRQFLSHLHIVSGSCKLFQRSSRGVVTRCCARPPQMCLCTTCTIPFAPNVSLISTVVNRVRGSVANAHSHCLCTSHIFLNCQCHFNIILPSLNDNNSVAISLTTLQSDKMDLNSYDQKNLSREYTIYAMQYTINIMYTIVYYIYYLV
jgi:hypothetical protein